MRSVLEEFNIIFIHSWPSGAVWLLNVRNGIWTVLKSFYDAVTWCGTMCFQPFHVRLETKPTAWRHAWRSIICKVTHIV